MKKSFWRKPRLYAVLTAESQDPTLLRKARAALHGGVDILQLRSKTLCDKLFLALASKLKQLAGAEKKFFVINDRAHVALLIRPDALHLGQDDLSIREARKIVGSKMVIGKSTHSLKQALAAESEGADYIGVGPIFKTPTKPTYGEVGLGLIQKVSRRIKIPFVTIGGIDEKNIQLVLSHGARHIAVVRAIFNAKDPGKKAKILQQIIRGETK